MDLTIQLLYDRILELEKRISKLESKTGDIHRPLKSPPFEPSDTKPIWLVDWDHIPTYTTTDLPTDLPVVREECKTCEGGQCTDCPWFTYITYTQTSTSSPEEIKGGYYQRKYYTTFIPYEEDRTT